MLINDIIDRLKLPFRKEKELYSSLYAITGVFPHNINYYKQALLHRSLAKRNANGRLVNNERLEFLGDAILDAIVGDIVYRHFEGKREGFLTTTRSKIVQRETLNRLSQEIGISRLILCNEHSSFHNSYKEGNAFEALVGALYLDRGYAACMRFMEKRILAHMINIDKLAYREVNFKSKLIEWCQKNKVILNFKEIECKRDDNNSPVFVYCAEIEGINVGEASGYSKKESQQIASKLALHKIRKDSNLKDELFAAKTARIQAEENTQMSEESTQMNEESTPLGEEMPSQSVEEIPSQPIEETSMQGETIVNMDENDTPMGEETSQLSEETSQLEEQTA